MKNRLKCAFGFHKLKRDREIFKDNHYECTVYRCTGCGLEISEYDVEDYEDAEFIDE